uniref:U34-theraphotoxin-Cg1a n=1 Tax=Chilobrachys guangxiensis TaxID=278060 RepID=JZT74_CHIGU|nr:RecName: Full=U34-theraphotoxin-Cg1a; Short=U34-TRTX-Cg1a; AltName: Full=Jingzhaotoxin-74; Short=JZTX-74; Flags: Precursor [Chilobrachys guangxiensis]ABY71742.1 cystine knot toxin [Chilobrachys guangxiensis]
MKLAVVFLLTTVVFTLAQSQCENCADLQCNSTVHCCLVSTVRLPRWKREISRCGRLAIRRWRCEEPNSNGIYNRNCPCVPGLECREFRRGRRICLPEQSSTSTSSTQGPITSSTVTTQSEATTETETTTAAEGK